MFGEEFVNGSSMVVQGEEVGADEVSDCESGAGEPGSSVPQPNLLTELAVRS